MSSSNEKFNILRLEEDNKLLIIEIDKVISEEGYTENFLPNLKISLDQHGELRILIHYKKFHGWEFNAAKQDMFSTAKFGDQIKKLALVNPPDTEVLQKTMKQDIIAGEIKKFQDNEYDEAYKWLKSD